MAGPLSLAPSPQPHATHPQGDAHRAARLATGARDQAWKGYKRAGIDQGCRDRTVTPGMPTHSVQPESGPGVTPIVEVHRPDPHRLHPGWTMVSARSPGQWGLRLLSGRARVVSLPFGPVPERPRAVESRVGRAQRPPGPCTPLAASARGTESGTSAFHATEGRPRPVSAPPTRMGSGFPRTTRGGAAPRDRDQRSGPSASSSCWQSTMVRWGTRA
jgi:hypothetical protein